MSGLDILPYDFGAGPSKGPKIPDELPQHPSVLILSSRMGGGKTVLINNLISRDTMFRGFFHKIYLYSGSYGHDRTWGAVQLSPDRVFDDYRPDEWARVESQIKEDAKKDKRSLIILDDVIQAGDKGNKMLPQNFDSPFCKFLLRHRHYNTSIWVSTQGYFLLPKRLRLISTYLALFSVFSPTETKQIAAEAGEGDTKKFEDNLREAARKSSHSFLFVKKLRTGTEYQINFTTPI